MVNCLAQIFRDLMRQIRRTIFHQHAKLVTAESRHGMPLRHMTMQYGADLAQHFIAGARAVFIIDRLELIQVKIQRRVFAARLSRVCGQQRKAMFEFMPVDQTR